MNSWSVNVVRAARYFISVVTDICVTNCETSVIMDQFQVVDFDTLSEYFAFLYAVLQFFDTLIIFNTMLAVYGRS